MGFGSPDTSTPGSFGGVCAQQVQGVHLHQEMRFFGGCLPVLLMPGIHQGTCFWMSRGKHPYKASIISNGGTPTEW